MFDRMSVFCRLLTVLFFSITFDCVSDPLKVTETALEKKATTSLQISKIVIKSDSGNIRVNKGLSLSVTAKKIKFNDHCQLDFELDGPVFSISSHKKSSFFDFLSKEYRVDFDITVPSGCSVEIDLGMGNTVLTGVLIWQ